MAVLLLVLVWPLSACGGVGTAAGNAPSTTAQAAGDDDLATALEREAMPAVGDTVTLRSMAAAAIPKGKLIELLEFDQTGKQYLRLVIDPAGQKGFREMATMPNEPYPGFDFLVFDDGGHSEMGELNLEITPYGGATFKQLIRLYDQLSGKVLKVANHDTLEGRQTFVVKTTVDVAEGGGTIDVTAWVDPATELVVREEYQAEDGTTMRKDRRVIDATPELLSRMDIKNMEEIVAGYREVREQGLSQAPYPVYGLPSGYRDLPLTSVIPAPGWKMVVLNYGVPGPNEYISVTTLDPKKYPGYGGEFLAPLDKAWIDPEGAGSVTEMRFGIGDVGVQIQARRDIIEQVARDLIVVGGPGN